MNWFKKILNFFGFRNEIEALPEGNFNEILNMYTEENNSDSSDSSACSNSTSVVNIPIQSRTSDKFDEKYKVEYAPKLNTVEFAIQQYLLSIKSQLSNGFTRPNSYIALSTISAFNNDNAGNNEKNEKNLIEHIDRRRLNRIEQLDSDKNVAYQHVCSKQFEHIYNRRIYLNCKREDISVLAKDLVDELQGKNFYFKFATDKCAEKRENNKPIIFYTSDDDLAVIINSIRRVFNRKPECLKNAYNINPFMKNIDGYISITPDISESVYKSLDGNKIPIDKTYNSLLSEALEESFVLSCKQLSMLDKTFNMEFHDFYKDDVANCAKNLLSNILEKPDKIKKLIDTMKNNLSKIEVKNNKLDIKGIEPEEERKKYYAPASSVLYQK